MLESDVICGNLYFILFTDLDEKQGCIYRCTSITHLGIDDKGATNTPYKVETIIKRDFLFVEYDYKCHYVKVYCFRSIIDNSEIFLFVREDGMMVLPSLKNGENNYKVALKLDNQISLINYLGDHEFLHCEVRHVIIREINRNKKEKDIRSDLLKIMEQQCI